jgi:hypothetical protein
MLPFGAWLLAPVWGAGRLGTATAAEPGGQVARSSRVRRLPAPAQERGSRMLATLQDRCRRHGRSVSIEPPAVRI